MLIHVKLSVRHLKSRFHFESSSLFVLLEFKENIFYKYTFIEFSKIKYQNCNNYPLLSSLLIALICRLKINKIT